MTVTDLLLNFRSALLALAPLAERVGIPWKRPDSYDEWDAVAAVLFNNLVVQVLKWSLPDEIQEALRLPSYDLQLESYRDLSTIEVVHETLYQGRWVFHAFGTVDTPFDVVEVRPLSETGRPLTKDLETCPVSGAYFVFRVVRNGASACIEEVAMSDE